ncbi:nolG, partial [Symbiodinium sp. CCMP2456]
MPFIRARIIEDQLRDLEGISKVELLGFPAEEIVIEVDEEALRSYNLSFEQVGQAVAANNFDITGGTVKTDTEELLIRARYKDYDPSGLLDIVVRANREGSIVRLIDVATVRKQFADEATGIELDGQSAVQIQIQNTDSEDILSTAIKIRAFVSEFNAQNSALQATIVNDRADVLEQRKSLLIENGIIGIVLVLLLLSLFLHVRIAFWVAAGLPVSFFGMFILAHYFGATINVISLFGMIVVVGILVDDGIVVSENIYHHYEKGKNRIRAAIDGTLEVLPAVISAVLTTMIAFASFFFIDGTAGDFFSEMAFIVIATLAVSLIEALIILPAHIGHSKALSLHYKKNKLEKWLDRAMAYLRENLYRPVITFSLKYKFIALSIAAGLFIITLGAMQGKIIRISYFPFIDRDNFEVQLKMPAGTRKEITAQYLNKIRLAAKEVNDSLRDVVKNQLKEEMKQFSELRDVVDNDLEGVKEVRLKLKDKAFLLGLNPAMVMQQVRNGFFGYEVQRLQIKEDEVKVWVRYSDQERSSLYHLENMFIRTAQGGKYPLSEIADYTVARGPLNIYHLNGKREIKVEADLADPNGSAPDAIDRIRTEVLEPLLEKYPEIQ